MFNLSGSEIIVILLLALVVLGPEKLPDAMRRFGRTYGELKRMSTSFQEEMRSTIEEPMREMRDTIKEPMREMRKTADMLREQADITRYADEKPKSGNPMEDAPAIDTALPDDEDDDDLDDDMEFLDDVDVDLADEEDLNDDLDEDDLNHDLDEDDTGEDESGEEDEDGAESGGRRPA